MSYLYHRCGMCFNWDLNFLGSNFIPSRDGNGMFLRAVWDAVGYRHIPPFGGIPEWDGSSNPELGSNFDIPNWGLISWHPRVGMPPFRSSGMHPGLGMHPVWDGSQAIPSDPGKMDCGIELGTFGPGVRRSNHSATRSLGMLASRQYMNDGRRRQPPRPSSMGHYMSNFSRRVTRRGSRASATPSGRETLICSFRMLPEGIDQ